MQLDKKYTVFGRVIEGIQYVDDIAPGEPPENPTVILQASIESDGKPPVTAAPPAAAAVPSIVDKPAPARKPAAPKKSAAPKKPAAQK
jgi:peptidylprolyl isomerase